MATKATDIDLLYGLEPVIEPGEGTDGVEPFADITCPYCGEVLTVKLDLSAGSQSYIEDCQVCCQPMQIALCVAEDGSLDAVAAERMDR
ncbi:MAG TPA: CPXCG motif-containing cysteine-rich protein [Steroidobacteraceae bacterium]|nr:CPXCG motif-containing cysteine-rich protein [Steroidobacteraceae bacterium]